MSNKNKIAVGACLFLGGMIAASTPASASTQTETAFVAADIVDNISAQVKNVSVDYAKLTRLNDPFQTGCGVNCSC